MSIGIACFCNIGNNWGPCTGCNSPAPWVHDQSPIKLRKLGYLSIQFWYVCASTSPSAVCTRGQAMWNITLFCYSVGTNIAHPCCGQLTAVKTGYVLTSIAWPYFLGSRVSGAIEDTYFFEVICWQVSSFQLIAGSTPSRFLCDSYKFIVWSKYKLGALLLASAKSIVYVR